MATRLNFPISVLISPARQVTSNEFVISVAVQPADIARQTLDVVYPFQFNITPINVNLTEPIKESARQFLTQVFEDFIDEDRELKTLLNLGEDRQNVVLAYRPGPPDSTDLDTIQLKLLAPLGDEIAPNTPVFISTEVANTVIQRSRIRFAPRQDPSLFLRPRNTGVPINDQIGKQLNNVTLQTLGIATGSVGGLDDKSNPTYEDLIFRKWYSFDFDSTELNLNFTDFNDFVFYGSAVMRLYAFREKLRRIESLTQASAQFDSDVFTGSLATVGASYVFQESSRLSREKEELIRGFDRYEQHLYFTPEGTESPYAADAPYAEGGTEFNETSYWPKTSAGTLYSIDSPEAIEWFDRQLGIAERYDENNQNNLLNTIPPHVREAEDNTPYFIFVTMIGHHFDLIKPYIDEFPQIYSRYINPDEDLSKDLVSVIAESVGFRLPTTNSVFSLSDNILGTANRAARREFSVESQKRLLHNLPFFAKSRGTRTALRTVLRTLGITEQLVDIREAGEIASDDAEPTYVFSEFYNALRFVADPNEHIAIPVAIANRTPYPRSIQVNFSLARNDDMTVLNGDGMWALNAYRHSTNPNLMRIVLELDGGTILLSSDYFENTPGELINATIRTYDDTELASLRVIKVDQDDVLFDDLVEEDLPPGNPGDFVSLWNETDRIYLGGQGPAILAPFEGNIDEVRLWAINLSDETTLNTAFDPGSNAGDIFTDASDNLYVQVSLNKIDPPLLINSGSITNESPYRDIAEAPPLEELTAVGFGAESFVRNSRYVRQLLPRAGTGAYVTNKIKIVPPPVFQGQFISEDGVKRLSRTESIVSVDKKFGRSVANRVTISASPTTAINQNIIRNIGLTNVNQSYGIPNDSYRTLPNTFKNLQDHYNQFYYTAVDQNKFIRTMTSVFSVINQIIEYFIPSRASLQTGVKIEPTMLERTRIKPVRKIRFYGIGSRRTQNVLSDSVLHRKDYEATFTLSRDINISEEIMEGSFNTEFVEVDAKIFGKPTAFSSALDSVTAGTNKTLSAMTGRFAGISETLLGDISEWSGVIEEDKNDLEASFRLIDRKHLPITVTRVLRSAADPSDPNYVLSKELIRQRPGRFAQPRSFIDLGYSKANKVGFSLGNGLGRPGAEPYNRIYPRKLFEYEINRPRPGGTASLIRRALYSIPPSCDLREFGSRNYFIQAFGIYFFPRKIRKPFYVNPLNAAWDMETQEFVGATTWSFGERYQINDVVYQDVQRNTSDALELGAELTNSAMRGNGRFYAFKTRPSYDTDTEIGEVANYSGSVPSTLPPSLDKDNWSRIRFSPRIVPEPKRVVFDSFVIPDPALNDFRTTTVDINTRIDLPERFIDLFFIGSLQAGARRVGSISVQNIAALFAAQINSTSPTLPNIRLRLYRNSDDRAADLDRPDNSHPDPSAGVLLDMRFNAYGQLVPTNPVPTLVSQASARDGSLFYTIENLGSQTADQINLHLYYFATEIEPRLPRGYLRKHYRYFRDTSTATKRRNYLGCKNTEETTIDGLSPVQIFLSEGTEVTVSPDLENDEIEFGGGGTLDS